MNTQHPITDDQIRNAVGAVLSNPDSSLRGMVISDSDWPLILTKFRAFYDSINAHDELWRIELSALNTLNTKRNGVLYQVG
ncbi:MAG: hypothetical protein ACRCXZ_00400 [Patescibacteria group bacterium]